MTHHSLNLRPCLVLRFGHLVVRNHYWIAIASEQEMVDRGLPAKSPGGRWFDCLGVHSSAQRPGFRQRCGGDTGSLGGSRNVVHSRI